MARPLVTLTTDFGLADPSVGICKGVILGIAPETQIVDISHGIARHAVLEGAVLLRASLPYFPIGVHMAVVDPGVGTERRPVAILTGRGDYLVGPDNGLLLPAAEVLGGVAACHELANASYRIEPVSRTFHGRDIFSPAAAHLATGVALEALGPEVDTGSLTHLDMPQARVEAGALEAIAVSVDSFGSAQLVAGEADLVRALGPLSPGTALLVEIRPASAAVEWSASGATWRRTYGEADEGELVVLVDSYGRLSIAVNRGSASERLGLKGGMIVRLART